MIKVDPPIKWTPGTNFSCRSCSIEPTGTWYGGTLACTEGETIFIQVGQKYFAVILKYLFQNVFNMTGTVLISN